MSLVHHLVSPTVWSAFEGKDYYEAESLLTEKFIHFSLPEQVEGTLNRFFGGTELLYLLHIDSDLLTSTLVFETSGEHGVFPHLYGPLNKSAIKAIEEIRPQADGRFVFPVDNRVYQLFEGK